MVYQTQELHKPAHQDRTNIIVYLVTVALLKGSKCKISIPDWQTPGVKAQEWVETGWTHRVLESAYTSLNLREH